MAGKRPPKSPQSGPIVTQMGKRDTDMNKGGKKSGGKKKPY